ncbi:MAG: TIGR01906 family membrane protein [Dehalococcoidales bacterium]|nr:TIGR01906 family membrane protein [Dehalococcoidales bacterium]
MKVPGIAARWLFALCLPLLLVSTGIGWLVNSPWLYHYGFEKYGVSRTTGLSGTELDKAARGLIAYFNSDEEYIDLTVMKDDEPFVLFNQREVIHLKDVKGLFRLDHQIFLWTLTYVVSYGGVSLLWRRRRYWPQLARGLVMGSGFTLALMLTMGAAILLGFDQLFLQFHLLSFANDLWQLDPSRDYLIMLFPAGFWYDAALFCVLAIAGMAVVLGGVGWYMLRLRASPD